MSSGGALPFDSLRHTSSAEALFLCGGLLARQHQLYTALPRGQSDEGAATQCATLCSEIAKAKTDLFKRFLFDHSSALDRASVLRGARHARIDKIQIPLDRFVQALFTEQNIAEVYHTSYALDAHIAYYFVRYPFPEGITCNFFQALVLTDNLVQLVQLLDGQQAADQTTSEFKVLHSVALKEEAEAVTLPNVVLAILACLRHLTPAAQTPATLHNKEQQ